jgi:hypothetical protein
MKWVFRNCTNVGIHCTYLLSGDAEEFVPEHYYVQIQGGLLGRKWNAIATYAEPQTTGKKIQEEQGHVTPCSNCY